MGVDGSAGAIGALQWAAAEAQRHQAELTALLAWSFLDQPDGTFVPDFDPSTAHAALERWLAEAALPVAATATAVCDLPVSALVDASSSGDLVVVGSRGRGGFAGLLLGSVSTAVAERALCPVAVVRGQGHPTGPVVVGVDGSAQGRRALAWAVAEATTRGVPLDVVHTWSATFATPVLGLPAVIPLVHAEEAAERVLTDALGSVDLGGIVVHRHLVEGTPAGVLVERSRTAGVVVVGSRGRGGLTSVLLGSTSRHLLHHAEGPVVVVR